MELSGEGEVRVVLSVVWLLEGLQVLREVVPLAAVEEEVEVVVSVVAGEVDVVAGTDSKIRVTVVVVGRAVVVLDVGARPLACHDMGEVLSREREGRLLGRLHRPR